MFSLHPGNFLLCFPLLLLAEPLLLPRLQLVQWAACPPGHASRQQVFREHMLQAEHAVLPPQ